MTKNNRHFERYIDFDDLNSVKTDMYVDRTIRLAKVDTKTMDNVENMTVDIECKVSDNEEFKKEIIFSFFQNKKI